MIILKLIQRVKGDLFDSLEIEEALMLHFSVMSEEENKRLHKVMKASFDAQQSEPRNTG